MENRQYEAELVVAGGLLEAAGGLAQSLTPAAATDRLRELLSPAALWWSGPLAPSRLDAFADRRFGQPPRWREPDPAILETLAETVLAAWRDALPAPEPGGWGKPVLRIEVDTVDAAQRLASLASVGPYLIVPSILGRHAGRFSWRWPMRIGVVGGPRGDRWRRQLERLYYNESLYEVHAVDADPSRPLDIVFVDADSAPIDHAATCVVVMGDAASPAERALRGLADAPQAAIVVGAASADIGWFEEAIRQMAHDQPIDVALRIASPDAVIAADSGLLALTAVRQWSLGLVRQVREQAMDGPVLRGGSAIKMLHAVAADDHFDREDEGARRTAGTVRGLDREGYETVLQVDRPMAGAPPPEASPAPPPGSEPVQAPVPARRLIADARANGKVRRKTLLPEADHELHVRIDVPRRGETAAQDVFPEGELPRDAMVELVVTVASGELGLHRSQPIKLSTANRSASSTIAVFPFRTPGEGTVADIKILVSWRNRPLQEAHYVATVRRRAVPGDRVSLEAVPLSGPAEPAADATPADVLLEVNGPALRRSDSRDAIDLSQIRDHLESIEQAASRVLADDDAPETLADATAAGLLVQLARMGTDLKRYLRDLEIDDARTISLLVGTTTPILPLELVYDARAPREGAKLCEHRPGGSMVGRPEACSNAGEDVVCPYAFWGQQRTILRTIRKRKGSKTNAPPQQLRLSPVLYAAVKRADAGAPRGKKPSDALEAELAHVVGATKLARVASWEDWKQEVRQRRPQLMVLLGHTESSGLETGIEIGKDSWLSSTDINDDYMPGRDAPPPLLVLLACSTGVPRNPFGGLPAAFTDSGAAAVVATLTKLTGPHGARAAAAVVQALFDGSQRQARLAGAMMAARRRLLDDGLLVGMLLVSHGEIDLPFRN